MKHRPSHLKRLERREERSEHEIETAENQWEEHYKQERTTKQIKKQAKQKAKRQHEEKPHMPKSLEEKEKLEKHRNPVIRERSHQPRPQK